jgi:hypothetical protein
MGNCVAPLLKMQNPDSQIKTPQSSRCRFCCLWQRVLQTYAEFASRLALGMVNITERQDFHAGVSPTTVRSSKRRPPVRERPVPMSEIWNLVNRAKLEDEELDVEPELYSAWLISLCRSFGRPYDVESKQA